LLPANTRCSTSEPQVSVASPSRLRSAGRSGWRSRNRGDTQTVAVGYSALLEATPKLWIRFGATICAT
jgi:hypothetical protein